MDSPNFLVARTKQESSQLRNGDKELPILRSRYGPVEQTTDISEANDLEVLSRVDIIGWFLSWFWSTVTPQKLAWLLTPLSSVQF